MVVLSYLLSRVPILDLLEAEMVVLVVLLTSLVALLVLAHLSMIALKKANFCSWLERGCCFEEVLIDRISL